MIDSPVRGRPAWLDTLVFTVVTASLVVTAAFVMFSAFMYYDDEGYVLISLRNFAEHGGLYRDVYTQYGPFPFVFYYGVQTLGLPLTHTTGRLITLGAWTGAALACAAVTGYATRSLIARVAVLAGVFVYLWVMASEPTHPGGLIVLLTTVLAALGYRWIVARRTVPWAILTGGVTAALLLTKINVGIFAAFSACTWWLLHHSNAGIRRWAPMLAGAWTALLPWALMRPLLGTPWVQTYAWVFACSGVATVIVTGVGAIGRVGWRTLGVGLLGAAVVAIVILSVVVGRGTQPHDLLEGLLLGPLRQPTAFTLPFIWPRGIAIVAVVSLLLCAAACWLRRRNPAGLDLAIAVLRLVATLSLAINIAHYPIVSPDYAAFGFALPCLWIFVWPLSGEAAAVTSARSWIALLLLSQSLHVFPVPGSQIAWGTVLVVPLAALGAWDAARWLARQSAATWLASLTTRTLVRLIAIGFIAITGWKFTQVAGRYRDGQNLGLPGAETIRVPDGSAALFRVLALNAVAHGDMLFSLPGMFSLNLWTGVPTPTHANVTHWFSLLDSSRQQAMIDALQAHPRACVIIYRTHVDFLAARALTPRGLLHDYIAENFETAFTMDQFEFRVHRGRKIEPFLLAELLTRAGADGTQAESTLLRFAMLLPPRQPIARIELTPHAFNGKPLVLDASNARVEVSLANPRGEPAGVPHPTGWPVALTGPSILSIYYNRESLPTPAHTATIILRDATGAEVGLARLRP